MEYMVADDERGCNWRMVLRITREGYMTRNIYYIIGGGMSELVRKSY